MFITPILSAFCTGLTVVVICMIYAKRYQPAEYLEFDRAAALRNLTYVGYVDTVSVVSFKYLLRTLMLQVLVDRPYSQAYQDAILQWYKFNCIEPGNVFFNAIVEVFDAIDDMVENHTLYDPKVRLPYNLPFYLYHNDYLRIDKLQELFVQFYTQEKYLCG